MAMTNAEKQAAYRARRRGELAAVPDAGPGPVARALEETLAALKDPDATLTASARALAATLDAGKVAHPAVAAELRRTVGQLRADERQKTQKSPQKPASALAELRQARARRNQAG